MACVSGARFLVGVPVDELRLIMVDAQEPQASSYFGMCAFLVTLDHEMVRRAGGFVCVLSERQAIEIPPGYLVAECPLTAKNTVSHWVTMRATDLEEFAAARLDKQVDIVFQALRVDQKQEQPCEVKNSIVERTLLQMEVAPVLFKWFRTKIGSEPVEDTGLCKVSLDPLQKLYMTDKGFQRAVLYSATDSI